MDLRNEVANGIARRIGKLKIWERQITEMEMEIEMEMDMEMEMENLQAMLYYTVYTLWLWTSEIMQKLNGK